MKIFSEQNIGSLIILNSCLVGFLIWLGTVAHTLWDYQINARQDLKQLEENYITAEKINARRSVNDFIQRTELRKQFSMSKMRHTLQEQVEQVHALSSSIYELKKDSMSRKELEQLIIETIRPLRFNNKRGYFFIRSLSGTSRLYPPDPIVEGSNISKNSTGSRAKVINDNVNIVRTQGHGFNEYLWPKPGVDAGKLFPKISFISHFAPFDWYIGTGEYIEATERDIQEQINIILNQSTNKVSKQYLFIYALKNIEGGKDFATMLVNPNRPDLLGKNLSDDYKDARGKEFRKEMLNGLRKNGEVFVKYWYKKPGETSTLPKMSYFKLYPEWNWIVARGFYFDDLALQIAAKKKQHQQTFQKQILNSIGILCFFLLIFLAISLMFSQKVRKLFQAYRLRLEQSNIDLKRARDEANEAATAKGDFLANMSHEIRTPMNGIIGLSELAMETELSKKQQDYLHKIHSSSLALLGILNGILDFSRIEAGKLILEQSIFRLSTVFNELVNLFETTAQRKGLQLNIDLPENIPEMLIGDPLRLRQVLVNLLGNGIKFTEKGTVALKVELIAETDIAGTDQCQIKFRVIDSGIGIAPEKTNTIFDSFTQCDSSTARHFGGSGLGLTISHRLVSLMGGTLEVESLQDQGSNFSFTIAFDIAPENDLINSKTDKQTEAHGQIPDAKNIRILLVEDNAINQQVAIELLQKTGAEIDLAPDGMQAIKHIARQDYDLIFMDIQMPEMDGFTLCRIIRTLEEDLDLPQEINQEQLPPDLRSKLQGLHLPIIAMTANVMIEDQHNYILAGMDGFIGKPFNSPELYEILKSQLHLTIISPDKSQVISDADLPDTMPGLNIDAGINRLEGNIELYLRLLQNFAADYANVDKKLQETFSVDLDKAKRTAHTVKGTAASLGAMSLAEAAAILEQDLIKTENITESLPGFSLILAETLQAIRDFAETTAKQEQSQTIPPETKAEDKETLIRQLADFKDKLANNDFMAAQQWQQLKPYLNNENKELVQQLESHINSYNFTRALELLTELEIFNENTK